MTEQQIIEALAVKVMGWEKRDLQELGYWYHEGKVVCRRGNWNPLQNIADAWQVVEKLRQSLSVRIESHSDGWYVELKNHIDLPISGEGKTAQEAICKAAMEAVA